jgi:5-methyltetrahydropteroyltriglutamate--homocysteine methyltransferase
LPKLELNRDLIQRVKEAAQYLALENMCLSPQCGFSSTFHGNEISEDDQWAKLELVVKTAVDIWGDS